MSLSHKPGLLSEQGSQLMITLIMFDKWFLEDHHSACCSAPLLGLSSTLTHLTKVGINRVHKLYSEVTHPQQSEHRWAVLGASLAVTSTIRAATEAKKERMIQLLITYATERNNLASPNFASSRFWFSSHQQKSNLNREDRNQKGKREVSSLMNCISSLKAYRSIKAHRRKGKGLDNWKPEKREDRVHAARRGTDLLDQLGQFIKPSHRWSSLVCVTGLLYHSDQNSQSRTAGVSPACQSHSMDVTCLQGPALQTQTTELEGACPVGNRLFQHTQCYMNLLIFLLCDTKDKRKEQCSGTQQFWRHEVQQLCLLLKAQYYTKCWGLVLSMI